MIVRECMWYECVHMCVDGDARLTEGDSVILPPYPVRSLCQSQCSPVWLVWPGPPSSSSGAAIASDLLYPPAFYLSPGDLNPGPQGLKATV